MTNQVNKINPEKHKDRNKPTGKSTQSKLLKGTHDVLDGSFIRNGDLKGKLLMILFLATLGLLYIANNHFAEKKIREIDRLRKENKELSFKYLSMKTKLNEKKRASYLAEKLAPYGLHLSTTPPEKILANP
ncbi:MAG: hypothetical protein K9H16_10950 [Bacteroidales bacterium]|nr:hypothetical protein [Bacteroidales bacterium]